MIPDHQATINDLENNLYYMNIRNGAIDNNNGKSTKANDNDYELLRSNYRISPPPRSAPKPPIHSVSGNFFLLKIDDFDEISKSFLCFTVTNANKYTGTLGAHTELDGVPFVLNSALSSDDQSTAFDVRIKFK